MKMLVSFYTTIIESIFMPSISVWSSAASSRDKAKLQRVIQSAEKVLGSPGAVDLQDQEACSQDHS